MDITKFYLIEFNTHLELVVCGVVIIDGVFKEEIMICCYYIIAIQLDNELIM